MCAELWGRCIVVVVVAAAAAAAVLVAGKQGHLGAGPSRAWRPARVRGGVSDRAYGEGGVSGSWTQSGCSTSADLSPWTPSACRCQSYESVMKPVSYPVFEWLP